MTCRGCRATEGPGASRPLSCSSLNTHTLYWNGTDGMPGRQNKLQYVSEMLSGLGTISHVRVGLRAVSGHRGSSSSSLFVYSPLSAEVTEIGLCNQNSIAMVCIQNPPQIESYNDRKAIAVSSGLHKGKWQHSLVWNMRSSRL